MPDRPTYAGAGDPGPADEELRALLEDAVSDVDPQPGLDRIHARTKVTAMNRKRPWLYAAAGAVAATAATLVGVMVLADGGDKPVTAGPAGSGSPVASATAGTGPSGTAGSPAPSGAATGTATGTEQTVPVYYVADTNTGPRLFREFHRAQLPADAQAVAEAGLAEALSSSALDPDYRSPWAALAGPVQVADVTSQGGTLVVDLTGAPADRPQGMSEQEAQAAVQQLVYTVQAAFQKRAPVQLLLGGRHTDTLLGVPVAEPLAAADPMQVQGTVWVIDPQDGAHVGSTFTVTGRGAFFEANVSWQLLQGGKAVKEGHGMAKECCTLSPFTFKVTGVEPGDYVLRVYDADMSGGEGNGEAEDTKRVTVE